MERIPKMKAFLEIRMKELLEKRLGAIERALLKNQMNIWDKIEEVISVQSNFVHSHQEYDKGGYLLPEREETCE